MHDLFIYFIRLIVVSAFFLSFFFTFTFKFTFTPAPGSATRHCILELELSN